MLKKRGFPSRDLEILIINVESVPSLSRYEVTTKIDRASQGGGPYMASK